MAVLFDVKENNITYHIQSVYKTHELEPEATTQKIRVVRKEGNRQVKRSIDFYNLDLDVRSRGVTADIYSGKDLTLLRNVHNSSMGVEPIDTHLWTKPSHDRWLIIDDSLYHCGHSIKDMGRKLSAITLMGTSPETILGQVV